MRGIGKVKWFGGRNRITARHNDYGFIARDDKPDIYVNRKQVRCSESDLDEGTPVTFEVAINPRNGKEEAKHLLLLKEETDLEVIAHCAPSNDEDLWMPVFGKYLVTLSSNEAVSLAVEKINTLSSWKKEDVALSVPKNIQFSCRDIREVLPAADHLYLCLEMLDTDADTDIGPSLREEIIATIETSNYREELWKKVPSVVYENDPDIRRRLPLQIHVSCLVNLILDLEQQQNRDILLSELRECLEESRDVISDAYESGIWELIPDAILMEDQVWPTAPPDRRIVILVAQLGEESNLDNEDTLSQIGDVLNESSREDRLSLVPRLPDWVKQHDAIFAFLPPVDQVVILVAQLGEESNLDNEDTLSQIGDVLNESSREDRLSLVPRLPDWVKQHDAIFAFLPPVDQVNSVWSSIEVGSLSGWQKLSREAKILCIYRNAKENKSLPLSVLKSTKDDPLVRCVLILLWAKDNPQKSCAAFKKAHTLFQDYVVDQAWSSTEPLDLYPLLPHCRPTEVEVEYCEGRPWPTEEDKKLRSDRVSRAFCPRTNGPCDPFKFVPDIGMNWGEARLYAECSQYWEDWSLLELIEATNVVPRIPDELKSPDEYVPKLSGWVNRLNEIRERLKCSVCGQIMPPNYRYAKYLARYNSTVVSCQYGSDHDQNVYLNHCWGCGKIIDSRESTIRVEGYYICIHCGSGPKRSKSYTQGDICPKCGARGMSAIEWNDPNCECLSCNHSIQLPPKRKLTGAQSRQGHNFI